MSRTRICFIVGANKTATSTLTGMLNLHPDIFMLYEVRMPCSPLSKYARQFLHVFPECRRLFHVDADFGGPYRELADWLRAGGHDYAWVGDKLPTLDLSVLESVSGYQLIFTVRDIRTWIVKNSVVSQYVTDHDVVPAAVDYTASLLHSYLHPACLRMPMEKTLGDLDQTVQRLSAFLDLDLGGHLAEWWSRIGHWPAGDPKNALRWWEVHPSSRISPGQQDTEVCLRQHPLWDGLLPIFDKYHQNPDHAYSPEEVASDLKRLYSLRSLSPVPLLECYETSQSVCLRQSRDTGKVYGVLPARVRNGVVANEFAVD